MKQFLGDAADIDAGPSQPPAGPGRAWFDEVTDGDLLTQPGGLLASGQAPRPAAYHHDVVVVVVKLRLHHREQLVLGVELEGVVTASDVLPIDEGVGDSPLSSLLC